MSSLFRRPGEFLDLIKNDDPSGKMLVAQYDRGNYEIKEGSKLIVRERQAAIFLSGGEVADIFDEAGTYKLDTGNMPIYQSCWYCLTDSVHRSEVMCFYQYAVIYRKYCFCSECGTKVKQ